MILNKLHSRLKLTQQKALINKNVSSFSIIKDKLGLMFSDQQFVMKLSSTTRVYPEYFSFKMLKYFLKSESHSKYQRYITQYNRLKEKVQNKKTNKSKDFQDDQKTQKMSKKYSTSQELFQSFPTYKNLTPFLDCYVDWLMKQKLVPESEEYYKNKCIMEMFDMRNPQNWFINNQPRHFIYHHGPTNSGKTSSAIKELKQLPKDKKGIYMAPLRLLAWETQQKLENCNLITGQDKQFRVSNLTSCTIEALNTNEEYDVAIIDEIQMIGDLERGWSWTKAILSTKAKKIHLCGDERAIGLVSKLIRDCGGTLEERKYSRLGKLKLIPKIFQMSAIQEGDCMIEFSVETLHKLRKKITNEINRRQKLSQMQEGQHSNQEKVEMNGIEVNDNFTYTENNLTQKQKQINPSKKLNPVAMVYGRLPPQCRKQQARKFNLKISPYLVATNAIGMGLNLNIKKIIFGGIKRRNFRGQQVQLEEHQIQQIAGRAGRGLNDGLVQCASYQILKKVRKALRNVNKTYGINLQDEQQPQSIQSSTSFPNENGNSKYDENEAKTSLSAYKSVESINKKKSNKSQIDTSYLQNYDKFLNRVLTQKQRSIEKAGLFIEYVFLKRIKSYIEQNYRTSVPLHKAIKLYLNLSLQSSDKYTLSEKTQLVEWLQTLANLHRYESRDIFQIAKCLSMHYNSTHAKQNMFYFAKKFKTKNTVPMPLQSIRARNLKQCQNNYKKLDILQSNYSVAQVYINLWNKYEFIFSDVEAAKQMKQEIARLIKEVLEDEEGFIFTKNDQKAKNKTQQEQNQLNAQLEEKQNVRQTILDEQTSDIQQIKI